MRLLGIEVMDDASLGEATEGGVVLEHFLVLGKLILCLGGRPEGGGRGGVRGGGTRGSTLLPAAVEEAGGVVAVLGGLAAVAGPPWRAWKGWRVSKASCNSSMEMSARSS